MDPQRGPTSGTPKGPNTSTSSASTAVSFASSVSSRDKTFTFQEAVEKIGFGTFHVMLVFLCGFGWFAEITELVIMSFVAPQIEDDFGLSSYEYGLLGSSSFIGMAIGAVFWGMMADRCERKHKREGVDTHAISKTHEHNQERKRTRALTNKHTQMLTHTKITHTQHTQTQIK